MTKPYAAWDFMRLHFRLTQVVLPGLPLPTDERAATRESIARTQIVEQDLSAMSSEDADLLSSRLSIWERTSRESLRYPYIATLVSVAFGPVLLMMLGVLGLLTNKPKPSPFSAWAFVAFGLILLLRAPQIYDEWRRQKRPVARFLDRRCPDCDYDLSKNEAVIATTNMELAARIGPRHCPECGAFWPLVPPDIPDDYW